LLFVSCQNNDKTINKISSVKNAELEMYVPSELASLMKDMYNANQDWKTEILKGNIPTSFPEEYKKIHTAQSTNENAGSDFYNSMSTSYLKTISDLTKAKPENVKERYNAMVNVCVSCHLQVCPGPIVKIKKLIIK